MRILKTFLMALLIAALLAIFGGAFLIRRGFRATSTPLPLEATLARHVRDFAMSRNERNRKNPFAPSSDAIEQGRDAFMNHCASCHGIDGGGRTSVGLNVYPKVPDLRRS